jgi:hypothetical protein
LITYFLKTENIDKIDELTYYLLLEHIIRVVKLMERREITEVLPYYFE